MANSNVLFPFFSYNLGFPVIENCIANSAIIVQVHTVPSTPRHMWLCQSKSQNEILAKISFGKNFLSSCSIKSPNWTHLYYLCLFTAFASHEMFCLHLITELLSVRDWGILHWKYFRHCLWAEHISSPDCILFLRNSPACLPYGKVDLGWRYFQFGEILK